MKNNNNIKDYDQVNDTLVYAMGGLNEIGKNMYCFEQNDEIIIIDCGVKFPSEEKPGISYIINDYTYLIRNKEKIKALIITHGHEDHIGGIPYFLLVAAADKIYASRFAKALIEKKLSERRKLANITINEFNEDSRIQTKYFTVGFFSVTHSIPDSYGIIITTNNGRIVFSGDFKFDLTPVGQNSDYQKMAFLGASGISLLMSESTNAEVEGFSISEKKVAESIMDIFKNAPARLLISTFASNVFRLEQIIKAAVECERKICVIGRSMVNTIEICTNLGFFDVPSGSFIEPEEVNSLPPEKVCLICTGSQGEPLAALSRIANGTHKQISIRPGDTIIFSSNPIPGNAVNVNDVINQLARYGANVIVNSPLTSLHTTGHASKEEQKLLLQLIKPKYFMPIHGEYKMLCLHVESAKEIGLPKENCFICKNGDVLVLSKGEVYRSKTSIQTDDVYIDGSDYSGLSTSVINDRKILGDNGMCSVIVCIDSRTNKILCKPSLVTRGFVNTRTNKAMLKESETIVYENLKSLMQQRITFNDLKNSIKKCLSAYFYEQTGRSPIIVPVILNHRDAMKKN
jgi:ribonuclease J